MKRERKLTHTIKGQQDNLGCPGSVLRVTNRLQEHGTIDPVFRLPDGDAEYEVVHVAFPGRLMAVEVDLLRANIEVGEVVALRCQNLQRRAVTAQMRCY